MSSVLQRLNLNIPESARTALRRIARGRERSEAEVARDLLVKAIDDAERDEFFEQVARAQTPALRRRQVEMVRAFEALDD